MLSRLPYHQHLLLLALLLLLIAATRAFRLDATVTEVTVDEVWSIWQGLGTPEQIIRWTPYDWPPGYYLVLAAWREMTGFRPIALRWLSLLAFVLGAAVMYRIGKHLQGDGAIAILAYAAFGYLIFMSTELRGYILLLAIFPLTIWLTLRYFEQPRLSRAIPLAVTMAALVYISLTSIAGLGALGLFTLIVYRRQVWRWWLPGGLALFLALPELADKASIMFSGSRVQGTSSITLKPFGDALTEIYSLWSGNVFLLWLILFGLAASLSLRSKQRSIAIALIVWSLLPIILYVTNPLIGFFNVRYAWWVMVGIALLLSVGLYALPKPGRVTAAVSFSILMLLPIPLSHYQIPQPPLATNFAWLREQMRPGDVILIDPNCNCGAPEVFAYYTLVYFPNDLNFVEHAGEHRRIWYVTGASGSTPETGDDVKQGRIPGIFVGPPEGLFRLYEAPPDPIGIRFENAMRFHGIDRLSKFAMPIYHEGDPIHVRLWWSVDAPPALDYSIGLYIINEQGALVAQDDNPPNSMNAPKETSQWEAGQIYVEERILNLPYPLSSGRYRLMMAVYWYGDGIRVEAPGVDDETLLPLFDFTVLSW